MKLDALEQLYIHELQDLHSAETQLVKALPKLSKAANSPELKSALTSHLAQTKEHVRRLDQLLLGYGKEPGGPKCKGMAGLIKEGQELLKQGGQPEVLDAGLLTAAQKVEHYEIAGYGAVRTYAQMLRDDAAVDVLQKILNEETQAAAVLDGLAVPTLSEAIARSADRLTAAPEPTDLAAARASEGVANEDADSYKGATEEVDNDAPRNATDESSGLGARWQTSEESHRDPVPGD